MKATIPQFRYTQLAFISVTACVLVFLGWNLPEKISSSISLPFTANAPTSEVAPQFLPFSYDDVVRYFEDALGYRAQQRFANQAVFRGGNSSDDVYIVTITRRDRDVLVAFNVVDDYGMQVVREFFEASFFQSRESIQFYRLLAGRDTMSTLHLPRFNVLFEYNSPGYETNIAMTFSPRSRSLAAPD